MFAHVDADSFFASVLQRKYPRLKGKPLVALGMGGGCVIAATYDAKRKGVRAGMRLMEARKLVPEAMFMPADFRATYDATRQIFSLFEKFCPGGVEHASPDEGYLDLSHHVSLIAHRSTTEALQQFAQQMQSEADHCLDLPISIGIAPTKTLAKMGSKHRKPKGICIIEKNDIESFLREKDIGEIPGIGWKSTPKMKMLGCMTALDFVHADPPIVEKALGKTGLELQREVQGEPAYRVITDPAPPKSISRCRSFRATNDINFLYSQVMTHLQRCSSKLRRESLECARISVWIRGMDYKSGASAERTVGRYVSEEALLLPFVKEAFEEMICHTKEPPKGASRSAPAVKQPEKSTNDSTPAARYASRRDRYAIPPQRGIRFTQVGLVLSDFHPRGNRQISLFEEAGSLEEAQKLQTALDDLRKKYGTKSIRYGGALGATIEL